MGRSQFTFNDTPVPEKELRYLGKDGTVDHYWHFNNQTARRINPRFFDMDKNPWNGINDGNYFHYTTNIEPGEAFTFDISKNIYKIKGSIGVQVERWNVTKSMPLNISADNGFSQTVTKGGQTIVIPTRSLSKITVSHGGSVRGWKTESAQYRIIFRFKGF